MGHYRASQKRFGHFCKVVEYQVKSFFEASILMFVFPKGNWTFSLKFVIICVGMHLELEIEALIDFLFFIHEFTGLFFIFGEHRKS